MGNFIFLQDVDILSIIFIMVLLAFKLGEHEMLHVFPMNVNWW